MKPRYGLRTIMELFDIGPTVAITVLGTAGVVIVAGVIFFIRSAPPTQLTISAGPEGSSFHRTATKYAKALEANGVKLNILTSNGSLQNLERIVDPKAGVDLALVQAGVLGDDNQPENLVSLGAISNQPVFVFYRGKEIHRLADLKGKTIAIGPSGSGTRKIALKLLDLNGIKEKEPGTTRLLDLDADDAASALENKKVDAVFIMSENASGEDRRKLLKSKDIKLLSFKNAAAYIRKVDYLNMFELPEGIIDFGLNIPHENVTLVGPVVEIVADKDLHPALSDLILDAAITIHGRSGVYQKRGEFPAPIEHKVKLSEDATRFYKSGKTLLYRNLPFWLASLLNRMLVVFLPILIVMIPVIRSIPAFFRWRSQLRLRKRYRELLQIEEKFRRETDPARIADLHKSFDVIDHDIRQMKVRAAFADQFYILRGHIDFVRRLMAGRVA